MPSLFGSLASLLAIGLALNFSPTVYAIEIATLRTARAPFRRVFALVAGLLTGVIIVSAFAQVIDPATIARAFRTDATEVMLNKWVDLVVGSIFVLIGVAGLSTRESRTQRTRRHRIRWRGLEKPTQAAGWGLFAFGVSNSVFSASGIALIYAANRILRSHIDNPVVLIIAAIVFVAAFVGPYLLVVALWVNVPSLAKPIEKGVDALHRVDLRRFGAIILIVVGTTLIVFGLGQGLLWSRAS